MQPLAANQQSFVEDHGGPCLECFNRAAKTRVRPEEG